MNHDFLSFGFRPASMDWDFQAELPPDSHPGGDEALYLLCSKAHGQPSLKAFGEARIVAEEIKVAKPDTPAEP